MVKITHMGIYFHGEKEFVYVDDQLNFTFLYIKTHIHGMLYRKLEFQSQLFYSIQKLVWITQMGYWKAGFDKKVADIYMVSKPACQYYLQ